MPVSAPPTLHFQWDSGQRVWEARRRESGTYQGVQASGIVVGDSTVTAYFEGQTSWLLSDLQDPWVCSFLLASLTPWPMLPSRKLGLVLVEVFMPFLWVRDPWWRVVKIWWNSWLCMKHSSDWVFFFSVFSQSPRDLWSKEERIPGRTPEEGGWNEADVRHESERKGSGIERSWERCEYVLTQRMLCEGLSWASSKGVLRTQALWFQYQTWKAPCLS